MKIASKCNFAEGRDEGSKSMYSSLKRPKGGKEEEDEKKKKKKKVCSWKLVSRPYFLLTTFLKKENR